MLFSNCYSHILIKLSECDWMVALIRKIHEMLAATDKTWQKIWPPLSFVACPIYQQIQCSWCSFGLLLAVPLFHTSFHIWTTNKLMSSYHFRSWTQELLDYCPFIWLLWYRFLLWSLSILAEAFLNADLCRIWHLPVLSLDQFIIHSLLFLMVFPWAER